jgi:hypothetical protein
MTLIVGSYSNENFSVTPKGKNYVGSSGTLQVKLIPKKHLVIAKAKGIDPVGGGNSPTVTLAMVDSGPIYDEDRKALLGSGKYKENKNLAVPLFFVDKLGVKDSSKTGKDKAKLKGTLNGTAPGGSSGFSIMIEGPNGTVLNQAIPSGDMETKPFGFLYKRPKGGSGAVAKCKINTARKTVIVKADSFDMSADALGTDPEPVLSVKVSLDMPTSVGGGNVQIRASQKKPGRVKF